MVVGENGVLNRATNASEKTNEAEALTALDLSISGAQGDFIALWNEDNTLEFMNVLKEGKISLSPDGYFIKWDTDKKGISGQITKGTESKPIGNPFTFELKASDKMGATISKWQGVER